MRSLVNMLGSVVAPGHRDIASTPHRRRLQSFERVKIQPFRDHGIVPIQRAIPFGMAYSQTERVEHPVLSERRYNGVTEADDVTYQCILGVGQ